MFDEIRLDPYKSTIFSTSENLLTVKAPWFDLTVELDDDHLGLVTNPLFFQQIQNPKLQKFLAFFKSFPLLNVLPRKVLSSISAMNSTAHHIALTSSRPSDIVSAMSQRLKIDYENYKLLGDTYNWNAKDVLDYSRIPGHETVYDPYSAYTFIRGLRLQYQFDKMQESINVVNFLKDLKEKNELNFFDAITDVMSQQYFVTSKCTECLSPALALAYIKEPVAAYISEEINHDLLIFSSIREISSKKSDELYYSPGIMIETELIRFAAQNCPLSFACLVSIMEGSAYPEHDPVGLLLQTSSKPQAAKGIEAHFQINKTHNHTAIPETFIINIPPVEEDIVIAALRMTEVAIKLDADMPNVLQQRFNKKYTNNKIIENDNFQNYSI